MNIPYNFPMHSLYRITILNDYDEEEEVKMIHQSVLQANKKQHLLIKWTKPKERCSVFMEIPSFDLVLYETKEKLLKERNYVCLPPSRRRPQTSISSAIKAR